MAGSAGPRPNRGTFAPEAVVKLGIDRQAPAVAVKKAYKELAKLHHPDRETGNLERFQAISKAWQEYQKTRAS